MGRNNLKNIKIQKDKLHQKITKQKQKEVVRKEKLKKMIQWFNLEHTSA